MNMGREAGVTFMARCPVCGASREVKGKPSPEQYPTAADGIRECACPPCAHVGGATPEQLRDREWLHRQYYKYEYSSAEIAGMLGCNRVTVGRHLRKHGLGMRTRGEAQRLRQAKRSERRFYDRNRQMVIGQGNIEGAPGSVRHFGR